MSEGYSHALNGDWSIVSMGNQQGSTSPPPPVEVKVKWVKLLPSFHLNRSWLPEKRFIVKWKAVGKADQTGWGEGFHVELLRVTEPSSEREEAVDHAPEQDRQSPLSIAIRAAERGATYRARVRPVGADEGRAKVSKPVKLGNPSWTSPLAKALVVVLTVAVLGFWAFVVRHSTSWPIPGLSMTRLLHPAAVLMALLFTVVWIELLYFSGQLGRALIVGQDGRVSTSKTTALLWTAAVGFVMAYFIGLQVIHATGCLIGGSAVPGACDLPTLLGKNGLSEQYLLLLGAPFGALIAAKAITSAKVDSGNAQRTTSGEARATQAVTNDAGEVDLVDSQYLLFNAITFGYFLIQFAQAPKSGLPELPLTLVALTGAGAATYVGNKLAVNNRLAITGLVPTAPVAGEMLQIRGRNFLPSGATWVVSVQIGGRPVVPITVTDTLISVVVPAEVPTDADVAVTVTTQAEQSESVTLRAAKTYPVTALSTTAKAGERVRLVGPPGVLTRSASALVAGMQTVVTVLEGSTTTADVALPTSTPAGSQTVSILEVGGRSLATVTINVAKAHLAVDPPVAHPGDAVRILLAGEPPANLVLTATIGGLAAAVTQANSRATVTVPRTAPEGAATIDLAVDGSSFAEASLSIVAAPVVASVSHTQAGPGNTVIVEGTGLLTPSGPVAISIGGQTIRAVGSATRVRAQVPDEVPHGDVLVLAPDTPKQLWPA